MAFPGHRDGPPGVAQGNRPGGRRLTAALRADRAAPSAPAANAASPGGEHAMSCIRRALRIDPETVRTVVDHLERHVAPHLAPDVSSYARGRQRAWLETEAPLGPTQPWRPGLASHRLWPWLAAVWRRIDPEPQLGLAVHGSTGIAWHRDASYAHARAALVNLGPCTFELDRAVPRAHAEPRATVNDTARRGGQFSVSPGGQFSLSLDTSRWSVVLWRLKRHPRRPVAPTRIP